MLRCWYSELSPSSCKGYDLSESKPLRSPQATKGTVMALGPTISLLVLYLNETNRYTQHTKKYSRNKSVTCDQVIRLS